MTANPLNGGVVAAWQQDRNGDPYEGGAHGIVYWSSATGGTGRVPFITCSGGIAANNGAFERASDVWLSWGPDCVLYQSALVFDESQNTDPYYDQSFTPTVAAGGTVGVTYYDFRNNVSGPPDTDNVDYWAQTSTDGGKTWGTETRLTASSFPASYAPKSAGLVIGDYEALTRVGDTFVAAF